MSDTGWLVVAIVFGVAFAVFWVWRQRWIYRRRRARRERDEPR